jgi:hypothetical protein
MTSEVTLAFHTSILIVASKASFQSEPIGATILIRLLLGRMQTDSVGVILG